MAKIHPGSKGTCRRCYQDVVLFPGSDGNVWKHTDKSQRHRIEAVKIKSPSDMLSKSESDAWVEKLGTRQRAIGTSAKPVGTSVSKPTGPSRGEEDQIKPKSLQQRKRRDADRKLTWKERIEKSAKNKELAEKRAAEAARGPELTDTEYWHPSLGYHYPKKDSTNTVVDPNTREFVVPKTGGTGSYYKGNIPAKPGESDPVAAAQAHVDTHPDHKWETAVDYASTPPTPLISPAAIETVKGEDGKKKEVFATLRHDAYRNGMLDWAQHHKDTYDTADRYEYLAAKPSKGIVQTLKNFFTPDELRNNRNSWVVKRRLKYCAQCSPVATDKSGKVVKNPNQSVSRPPVLEIPDHPAEKPRTGAGKNEIESIFNMRRAAGLIPANPNKYVHGDTSYKPNRKTGSFGTGMGEGRG